MWVVAMADTHTGHRLGLCNPAAVLTRIDDDGQATEWRPELGVMQTYLWQLYSRHSARAVELAAGDDIALIHDGDITHGVKFAGGLMDVTGAEQEQLAAWNLKPWLARAQHIRLFHGTEVHSLVDGMTPAEARVAAALDHPDAKAAYHERCAIGQVIFDVAHHGPNDSSRLHLAGNNPRIYLRDRMCIDADELGIPPARVYLRGHYHKFVWVNMTKRFGGVDYVSDLIVLPSYCGATAFSRKATQSVPVLQNGMVLFQVNDGKLAQVVPLVETLDLRVTERIA